MPRLRAPFGPTVIRGARSTQGHARKPVEVRALGPLFRREAWYKFPMEGSKPPHAPHGPADLVLIVSADLRTLSELRTQLAARSDLSAITVQDAEAAKAAATSDATNASMLTSQLV